MHPPAHAEKTSFRLEGLDAARGIAIALMFLSHTVKSVLWFRMMPSWGIVPVHAITKFSSALFIIVFGATVAVVYAPKVGTSAWPKTRLHMWKRGLLIMFWYKVLIFVQMFERSKPQAIIDTLLWKRFPDFVEILQFYAWFMLVLPLILPLWARLPHVGRLILVVGLGYATHVLQTRFDFWGIWQLKAVLVEHERAFCFGVLSRGTMVLAALWVAQLFLGQGNRERRSLWFGFTAILAGAAMLGVFYHMHSRTLMADLFALAKNAGKHPPSFDFVMYANGGALILFGLMLLMRGPFVWPFRPFIVVGRESLLCFNLHIIVIFVGYRYLLGLRHGVTYPQALMLTGLVFVLALVAASLNTARKRRAKEVVPPPKVWRPPHDPWMTGIDERGSA